jgi:hypothetical protein
MFCGLAAHRFQAQLFEQTVQNSEDNMEMFERKRFLWPSSLPFPTIIPPAGWSAVSAARQRRISTLAQMLLACR